EARGDKVVVLDIPLLFETGGDRRVDAGGGGSAPPEGQRARGLGRPGMTPPKLPAGLPRRQPGAGKTPRPELVRVTPRGVEAAPAEVRAILAAVAKMPRRRR